MPKQQQRGSRREFIKRAAYAAPAILTLKAAPSFAKPGSAKDPKDPKDPKLTTSAIDPNA
jgi:hypothetical protein